jgi:hypothetical protein
VGIGLAAAGLLPPVLAAAAQSLPDVAILLNSARLLSPRTSDGLNGFGSAAQRMILPLVIDPRRQVLRGAVAEADAARWTNWRDLDGLPGTVRVPLGGGKS